MKIFILGIIEDSLCLIKFTEKQEAEKQNM